MESGAIDLQAALDNRPAKWLAVAFSTLVALTTSMLLFGIINYEANNHYRVLMGRLVSLSAQTMLIYNCSVQVMLLFLYIFGTMHPLPCLLETYMRNLAFMRFLALLDSSIIVRYIFTLHSKNPTAVQDDFWAFFISTWIYGAIFLAQTVFWILPGRQPSSYYVCIGKFPEKLLETPLKFNWSLYCLVIFSFVIHVILITRLRVHKFKHRHEVAPSTPKTFTNFQARVNKQVLFSITANVCLSAVYVMSSLVPTTLNNIDPRKLSVFPNYLVIYTLHHYDPQLLTGLIVLVYYSKSQQLRDFFKREWLDMFRYFKKE